MHTHRNSYANTTITFHKNIYQVFFEHVCMYGKQKSPVRIDFALIYLFFFFIFIFIIHIISTVYWGRSNRNWADIRIDWYDYYWKCLVFIFKMLIFGNIHAKELFALYKLDVSFNWILYILNKLNVARYISAKQKQYHKWNVNNKWSERKNRERERAKEMDRENIKSWYLVDFFE